jgi:uncharacterized protein (DUF58 family)
MSRNPVDGAQFFKQVRRIELVSTRLVETLLAGNYRSVFRGMGIEFDEVREYVAGDDSRLIDWNVTSRMGSPYTKTFREERELSLFLVVDLSASLLYSSGEQPKNRAALMVFAILAVSAVLNNDRVGALFFSDRIERFAAPGKGRKHVLGLINYLIGSRPQGKGSDLALALRTVSESLKRRGICFIISDFKAGDYWDALSHLARRHDVIAAKLTDPVDFNFPEAGMVDLVDPETGETLLASGMSEGFRRSYKQFWEEDHHLWHQECRKRGVETLCLETSDDPGLKLVQFFQRRKRR